MIEPDTEADPVAVLVTLLAGASAMIGRGPHLMIANTRHPLTVSPLIFGRTADGRKRVVVLGPGGAGLGRCVVHGRQRGLRAVQR